MSAIDKQVAQGAVIGHVNNVCPVGTKFHVLEVGWLECDEAFVVRGGNISLASTKEKSFVNKRRQLPMYCVLIDHPVRRARIFPPYASHGFALTQITQHDGLILWETGCGKDYPEIWGPVVSDIFARVRYEPQHELRADIAATGHKIEDVKKVIIGHLHVDHAGGLDEFLHRPDVEVWGEYRTPRPLH